MADKRVEYTIGVRNEGLQNLTRVIEELDKAGVETTEFKRQAEQLRQQLADMARQQSLIDSFVKIKQETVSAGAAFEAAQAKAQQLGRELAATDAPTKKQTAEFGRAREAVNSTKDAYQAAQLRLQAIGLRRQRRNCLKGCASACAPQACRWLKTSREILTTAYLCRAC